PLTLLQIDTDTDYCIVEMGTNHPGEMASLTQIAEPDISVVTLVGEAHIGMFGSKDLIGREKQDIYKHPEKKPFAIFNLDNDWTQKMYLDWKNPTQALTFSGKHKADVSLRVKSESLDSMTIEGT